MTISSNPLISYVQALILKKKIPYIFIFHFVRGIRVVISEWILNNARINYRFQLSVRMSGLSRIKYYPRHTNKRGRRIGEKKNIKRKQAASISNKTYLHHHSWSSADSWMYVKPILTSAMIKMTGMNVANKMLGRVYIL